LQIVNGELVAYRNHDLFGRGEFNKATFYEVGQSYEDWHCDPNPEDPNSFGLGVWPKGNTKVAVPTNKFVVAVAVGNRADGKARVLAFRLVEELT
jgi:hypothetical protein